MEIVHQSSVTAVIKVYRKPIKLLTLSAIAPAFYWCNIFYRAAKR